ncbi:MAG: glutaredoxin [Acidobacteriota bacterium]
MSVSPASPVGHLSSQFIFNSRHGELEPPSFGFAVDLAEDPSAAHQLIKLGVSPRSDLPVVTLTDVGGKLRALGCRLSKEEAEGLIQGRAFPTRHLRFFGATWCPDCRRARRLLEEISFDYEEIDLDTSDRWEALVLERSGGRRVVPTLDFDGRLFVFNPELVLMRSLLESAAGLKEERGLE